MTSALKKIYIGNGKGGKISDYQISLSNPRNLWILQLQDAWNRGNHSPSAATKGSSLSGRLLRSRNLDPTTRQFDDSTMRQPHFIVKTQAIQQEAKPEFNKAAGKNKTQNIQPRNFQVFRLPKVHGLGKKNGNSFHILILWMEETLHHAVEVGSLSQDLQGFIHPRWENSPDVFHPQRPPNCSPPGSPNFRVSRARQRWLCLLRPHPMPEIGRSWFGERSCILKNFMPVWKTSAKTSVQVVFFSTCSKTESIMADSLCTFDENCIPSLVRGRPWVPFALSHPLQGLSPRREWWAKSIAKSLVPPIEAGGESGRENLGNTGPFLRLKPRFKSSNEPPLFDTFWVLIRLKKTFAPRFFWGSIWSLKRKPREKTLPWQLNWWLISLSTQVSSPKTPSTHLKNISQNGNLPQIGLKIKKIETTTQLVPGGSSGPVAPEPFAEKKRGPRWRTPPVIHTRVEINAITNPNSA